MLQLGIDMFGTVGIDGKTGVMQPAAKRMQEILEEIKLMDEVGLDFFGIGEHHRVEYAVASPEILLAAAAAVTKNIRLTSSVSVISSTDPVKLYKDFAMVDLLSDGRAEIMAGRGSFIESYPLYGYSLNDYEELFEEKLNLLLELNNNDTITWKGKFRAPLKNQEIFPQPKNGKLPIWIAVGGTPQSVIRAARLGLPVMFAIIGGSLENFLPLIEYYKQAWESHGHSMEDFQVGIHLHSFFNDKGEDATNWHFPLYKAGMDRIGKSRNWAPYERAQYDFGRSKHGHLIVGDPDYAVEKILHAAELFGLTRFSAHMDSGGPDHKNLMKAIEVYGTKVAPKVREALGNK